MTPPYMEVDDDRAKLLDLAERCEKATSDDQRRLFLEAFDAVFPADPDARFLRFRRLVDNSAFLDAAMTLVPEGCAFYVADDEYGRHASVWKLPERRPFGGCKEAATPALALTAAALRARAAMIGEPS